MLSKKSKFFIFLQLLFLTASSGQAFAAEGGTAYAQPGMANAVMVFAAVAAVGISCMTSAYALAKIGSAAMGAMSEKPELGGRALVFLGMAEGIAIYGLIVAIMILNKVQ